MLRPPVRRLEFHVTVIEKPAVPSTPQGDSDSGRHLATLLFFGMSALLIALVAALLVIGVIGLLDDDGNAGGGGGVSTVDVSLSEFAIDGNLTTAPGDVTLAVANDGSQQHNLVVEPLGVQTPMLNGGDSAELALGELGAGEYRLFCSVAGHAESGMDTTLVVSADAATGDGAAAAGHGSGGHSDFTSPDFDADAMDQIMADSLAAFPAETVGRGNQLLEPKILPDGTKEFELTAEITDWEVRPGEVVQAWSYNGMVPGPTIRTDVGDKVRVIFHNKTPMASDIHWHGLPVPNDQDGVSPLTQPMVKTGESYIYEFVTDVPQIAMYHAHMHSQISVPNGMFAAFIVGDNPIPYGRTISGVTIPEDLVPVQEFPMVLNDAGVIGLTLNGKSFPATEPVVIDEGDWVAVHYYNEGLTAHPMHLHGFPQLIYAKDGIPLDEPYWADTINVAPGERYSVLFQGTIPGAWVWHCHILTHVESENGVFGMATAVIVQ
jgi:plastocyanin